MVFLRTRASLILCGSLGLLFKHDSCALPGDAEAAFGVAVVPNNSEIVLATSIQPDGKFIVVGKFSQLNSKPARNIARANSDGTFDDSFAFIPTTNQNGVFWSALQADGKIFIGTGLRFSNEPSSEFARVNANGSLDPSFQGPNTDNVFTMRIQEDGNLILGGDFTNADKPRYLLRLGASGAVDTTFRPRVDGGSVFTMAVQDDGKMIIGGNFTSVGGVARNLVARILPGGGLDTNFNPKIAGMFSPYVDSLALRPDGKIIVGGSFDTIGGLSHRGIALLNTDGTVDAGFTANIDPTDFGTVVTSIAVQTDGRTLIAGHFTSVSGVARRALALLNSDGTVETGFDGKIVDGVLEGITLQSDGRIVANGNCRIDGQPRERQVFRMANYPATQSLTAAGPHRVQWLRGGSSPETQSVSFELSTNRGGSWSALGRGIRISGGWELKNLDLPPSGHLRARARVFTGVGNSCSGLLETLTSFTLAPEIAVFDGADSNAPALVDGESQAISFGTTHQGTPAARTFTISNSGGGELQLSSITVPAGFTALDLPVFPGLLPSGGSLSFQVVLQALAPGSFAGTVAITSNDEDEGTFDFPVSGTVVTPELAVYAGSESTALELADGQVAAVDLGMARQGSPIARSFTVANAGLAPLLLSAVSLPTGFSTVDLPPLPVVIGIGQSLTFSIQLDAAILGTVTGSIVIMTDDFDEAVFDFPVTGTVVAPEIAVFDGDGVNSQEISDGQRTDVNLGRNVQGTPGTRTFTIANVGTADLLIDKVTAPVGYDLSGLPGLPFRVGINAVVHFQISLNSAVVGIHSGSVVITSDDSDEASFDFPVTGEIFIPNPGSVVVSASTVLNRQTGLREQTIHVSNDTTATVPAYDLIIRGLPPGVEVYNASATRPDGSVVVHVLQTMGPHTAQDIVLEYYSPDRGPALLNPHVLAEVVLNPPDQMVPGGTGTLLMDRVTRLPNGDVLLEFTSVPGRLYQIQYSNDGGAWKDSFTRVRAAGNRTQWIDRGPPRTDSAPAKGGGRLYRVKDVTP